MCRSEKPPSTSTFQCRQSHHGPNEERSIISHSQVVIEGSNLEEKEMSSSKMTEKKGKKKSISSTAESLLMDKKMTCSGKSTTCSKNTQVGECSQTSVPVLTGKEKVLKPFFDSACAEMSKQLLWHTETDSCGLVTNSLSTSWKNVESNCCVTASMITNQKKQSSLRTYSALSPSSARVSMAEGTTKRIRKIIITPNPEVKKKLKQWMGCCRLTYNTALAYIKSGKQHKKTFYWLRNRFVNESNVDPSQMFLLETPKHVREGALKDLATAYKANFEVRKRNPSHTFDITFRRKKDVQSIVIPKDAFKRKENGVVLYPSMLSKDPIIDFMPTHDCRLSIDRLERFVLYVPIDVQKFTTTCKNQGGSVVACDPGVRTFLTTWSPNGEAMKLGDGDSRTLYEMMIRADKLISSKAKAKGRSKYRKNKVLQLLLNRIESLKRDLHFQCANILTKKYNTIIIPVFGAKNMSTKLDRKLNTKTVRSMLGMGHFQFRQRLKEVAERKGVSVLECSEEYTSKTCCGCGWIHPSLGGSKVFKCGGDCGLKIDRDLNGAINIYLKYIKEHPEKGLVLAPAEARHPTEQGP